MDTNIFNKHDIVLQASRCTFDVHLEEIVGCLLATASLVMLRPGGTMDLAYFIGTLVSKRVSYMTLVPTLLNSICDMISTGNTTALHGFRSISVGGEFVF